MRFLLQYTVSRPRCHNETKASFSPRDAHTTLVRSALYMLISHKLVIWPASSQRPQCLSATDIQTTLRQTSVAIYRIARIYALLVAVISLLICGILLPTALLLPLL